MLTDPKAILQKYWGFSSFKGSQEKIIGDVLNNKDVLALLPTGGGKSVCFQVPALAREGICIVVSPLVALIEDQVASLKKKGIKAIASQVVFPITSLLIYLTIASTVITNFCTSRQKDYSKIWLWKE